MKMEDRHAVLSPRPERPLEPIPIGARNYRAFVGPPETYDVMGALQFSLLTFLGLRQDSYLLDVGCGSLRAGRLFIPFLLPERYYGVEPEQWLIEEGIAHEVGDEMVSLKRPVFSNTSDFQLRELDQQFDFILAQSIFSHASLQQVRACLAEASAVLEPGGLMTATFCEGDDDYAGTDWVYPGCVSYTMETMMGLAAEQGFACRAVQWPHPAQQTWLVYAHEGFEDRIPPEWDAAPSVLLESELRFAKERLRKLETHPYVRMGLRVVSSGAYTRVRSAIGRLRKTA